MLKTEVLSYYQSVPNVARALEISAVAVHRWGEVVPYLSAEEIERRTDGALKVRRALYVRGRPMRGEALIRALAGLGLAMNDSEPRTVSSR